MPRGFSDREKAIIRSTLLEKGREYFVLYGLKKTSVEDLTRAAGISKGAFYLFYDSKEELFYDLLTQFEAEYQAELLKEAERTAGSPRESVRQFLNKAFSLWKTNALFTHFDEDDYAYMLRKLPEEKIQSGLRNDDAFIGKLFERWQRSRIAIDCEPRMFTNLMRALVIISLHEDDFAADVYPAMIDLLIDLLIQRLVKV